MNREVSKQYLPLGGEPVLVHTLRLLSSCEPIRGIYLMVPPGDEDSCFQYIAPYGLNKVQGIIPGGAERQDTVYKGLKALPRDTQYVVIHDGARPLATRGIVLACIEAGIRYGAATAAVPVKDTIKVADGDGFGLETLDRKKLWAVQTPQVFAYQKILAAHERFAGIGATDDSSLAEKAGMKVKIVEGSYENLKITTPEDLAVAEEILKERKKNANRNRF